MTREKTLKTTGSLAVLKKSPSNPVEFPCPTTAAAPDPRSNFVGNKSSLPLVQFPTSPQLILGEEILHFNHPQHPLYKLNLYDLFSCSGCKEHGSGDRFVCLRCDFQLHDFCALAPPSLKAHPFHSQHLLLFYSKPVKGGIFKSKCDVCGKSTKGYSFRCNACGFQMHPCCAMLSSEIDYPAHPHPLKLIASTPAIAAAGFSSTSVNNNGNSSTPLPPGSSNSNSGSSIDGAFPCGECRRKRSSSRVYRCTICDYHLHVVCAKNMINGLQANGIKAQQKPSMVGTAARVASQVVIEFIGGLIEGIGEGVGEVLVQNIARGRHNTNSNIASNSDVSGCRYSKTATASTTIARGRRTN